ncbi:MAG: phenylalanine--tRNA ligase beta subunit-related protein [Alphaproteobacteria bacterium]|nr:phenylalanine--tRNA ligase beta subunit-related protein [Alphaproteobacteria bacterium]
MAIEIALDISEVLPRFPDYRVAVVLARAPSVAASDPAALEAEMRQAEAQVAEALGETPLAEVEALRGWRAAYKAFGVKKTSYRSSVERLLKAVQQGRGLPRVTGLVDCYNAVSALYRVPAGADDLDRVTGPLAYRYARPGDSFVALGDASETEDPPKEGEVVYADAAGKVLCRRWNWYQDARSAVTGATERVVLNVQSLAPAPAVEQATAALCDRLGRVCGAETAWSVADRDRPEARIVLP